MRRFIAALGISLGLHGLFWRGRGSEVRASVAGPAFLWVTPSGAASTFRSRPPTVVRGSSSARVSSAARAPSEEWHTLGDLVAGGNRPPVYPPEAEDRGWEGTVVLRIEFDEGGQAQRVWLEQSSGRSNLDGAALEAARSWKVRGGPRVVRVPVTFALGGEG